MNALNEYISGRRENLSRRELGAIVDEYEWFTLARRVRAFVTADPDPALTLPLMFWPTMPTAGPSAVRDSQGLLISEVPEVVSWSGIVEVSEISPPPELREVSGRGNVIDRFIECGDYKITPTSEAADVDVEIDVDPEMVSEQLAEIYRAQGLSDKANEIYRLLNLRNS